MSLRKTEAFIADVEQQFEWYGINAGWDIAERYLAVESTCHLISRYPQLGMLGRFSDARLQGWRSFVVFRPFNSHILFYEPDVEGVVMRRAMHGHRDLSRRLTEPPA